MRILQVVPRYEPEREGVSALAAALVNLLNKDDSGAPGCIHLGEGSLASSTPPGASGPGSGRARAAELLRRAGDLRTGDAVLLHYVGYGYHPRGVPRWLAYAWEALRQTRPDLHLGVAFHEIFATGRPWQSSFWLAGCQRSIARRILGEADVAVTSLPLYRDLLTAMAPTKVVDLLPIPSTVGEPSFVPASSGRQNRIVVFGSSGVRERAYGRERLSLEAAVRELGALEIVDIGSEISLPGSVGGVPVRSMGPLPSTEVSRSLLASRVGFLAYPPDFLDKSTIFGAYLAHGLVPMCSWSGRRGREPGTEEVWVRATPEGLEGSSDFEALARRAREAYGGRSVAAHAELWRRRLLAE